MAKLTKRQKAFADKVETTKLYAIEEALNLIKQAAVAKFDESIDVAVRNWAWTPRSPTRWCVALS